MAPISTPPRASWRCSIRRPAASWQSRAADVVVLRGLALGLDQLAVDQALGDLDRIKRCTLAQVVGDDPHREPVLNGRILADAADVGRVLASALEGRGIAARLALIDDEAARRIAQDLAR